MAKRIQRRKRQLRDGTMEIRDAHFPGRAPLEAYGNGGFRFAGMSHRGSLLCVPSGIYGWDVSDASAFTPEAFQKVLEEQADIVPIKCFWSEPARNFDLCRQS